LNTQTEQLNAVPIRRYLKQNGLSHLTITSEDLDVIAENGCFEYQGTEISFVKSSRTIFPPLAQVWAQRRLVTINCGKSVTWSAG